MVESKVVFPDFDEEGLREDIFISVSQVVNQRVRIEVG